MKQQNPHTSLRNHLRALVLVALVAFGMTACDDPADDDDAGEQEFITKVTLTFTEAGTSNEITLVWSDPDGDGEGDFTGTLNLKHATTYTGTIELLNELADDEDERDITEEIREEADHHQFFYTFSQALRPYADITITDEDENGLPLGLEFELVTTSLPEGTASVNGTLNIVLSHYVTIVKNGTVPGNEEDVNITAPVTVAR